MTAPAASRRSVVLRTGIQTALAAACITLLCACPPGGGSGSDASADGASDAESDGAGDGEVADATSEAAADAADSGATDGGALDATVDGVAGDGAAADGAVIGEASADGGPACGFDAGSAPDGAPACGDGWRDPATEECDDGLGTSSPTRRGCSAQCQVLDELAVWQEDDAGALSNSPRTLGAGRHPVAASDSSFGVVYVEPFSSPLTLSLATFGAKGAATGIVVPFSGQTTVVDDSNPVVAGLPCGQYAVAWAAFGQDGGDELDVAIQLVDPAMPVTTSPAIANSETGFSQFDPDILWTGSQIVVAWVDDSDAATAPDLRFRTFDSSLNPTSSQQTLAATPDSEADVALATFAGSWAAAWRDDGVSGATDGLETIRVQTGTTSWTVGPAFLPAPVPAKPALAQLDATHLLVVYAVGADFADSGVANDSVLEAAVLDTAAPGLVRGTPVSALVASAQGLDQSTPAAVNVQGSVYVAWWTAAALGDPNGEELWLKAVGWSGTSLDLTQTEIPLPRWPQARLGDQEQPALAASMLPPGGAIVAGWNDLGAEMVSGEGQGDVVMELIPSPVLRTVGDGGP